jgi:hypothetical protein
MKHYWTARITQKVLRVANRGEPVEQSLVLPNANRVARFAMSTLGLEPIGKLVYVASLGGQPNWGVTHHKTRKAHVVRDAIRNGDEHGNLSTRGLTTDLIAESVAVHELTHLSGIPNWVFFSVNPTNHRYINYVNAGPMMTVYDYARNQERGGKPGGWLWEEGTATLAGTMYVWNRLPNLAASTRTERRGAPDGIEVDLPIRHTVNQGNQAYAGWGMERLEALAPGTLDILKASRKRGATWWATRNALRQCVESSCPGLFEKGR